MKILITGASGFLGKNLVSQLENIRDGKVPATPFYRDTQEKELQILCCTHSADRDTLRQYCREVDFIFHLAGVNRAQDEQAFETGNVQFTERLLCALRENDSRAGLVYASSVRAGEDSAYGRSKQKAEKRILQWQKETGNHTVIYRFPNIFGKWCKPNYNSVVATFCYHLARNLPIRIDHRDTMLHLAYVDDVVDALLGEMAACSAASGRKLYADVKKLFHITVGELADTLRTFRDFEQTGVIPEQKGEFRRKLYATYLSYLPLEKWSLPIPSQEDARGSFAELLHLGDGGQISLNISKPGTVKGQHWHHTKNEKFIVIRGRGRIQMRKIGVDETGKAYPVHSLDVSGDAPRIVEILPGYTHNLVNLSETEEMLTLIWANEPFDPKDPDTYREPV